MVSEKKRKKCYSLVINICKL